MSYFSYTNTISNGISADGGNVMTNFNDARAGLIDGTKDLNINNITLNGGSVSTVPYLNSAKLFVSSSVTPTELGYLSGVTSAIQTQFTGKATTTAWTAFTPTGSWSTNTTYTGFTRRVGDTGFYKVKVALSGAPTTGNLTLTMPAGNTIDTTKIASSSDTYALMDSGGILYQSSSSKPVHGALAMYSTTTAVKIAALKLGNGGDIHYITTNDPFAFANGDYFYIWFSAPIVEFA